MGVQKKQRYAIISAPSPATQLGAESRFEELLSTLLPDDLHRVAAGVPYVSCSIGSSLKVFSLTEVTPDYVKSTHDFVSPWIPDAVSVSSLAIQRCVVSIASLPGRTFFFTETSATINSPQSLTILKNNECAFRKQIALTARFPSLAHKLAGLSYEMKVQIANELGHCPSTLLAEFINEFQRFSLATTQEFKQLRTSKHLLKLIRTHLWFKHRQATLKNNNETEKRILFRFFRSSLRFPFGTKDVLSIAISLKSLLPDEQFDERHILLSCTRCLQTLEAVPCSFYSYRYAEESTISFYLELEKRDGTLPSPTEMAILKRELGRELAGSIEQVMSRIDIPQNEDDLLRNLLLLSQQIKRIKDIPQAIVQFHGQTDQALDFHVTLVRIVKEENHAPPHLQSLPTDILRFVPIRISPIDRLRNSYIKQGLVFLVQCSKEPFLRRDRSLDFLKARESVVRCVEAAFGKVRDLNGGLIYQHHQLLESIIPLLTKEESKELQLVEMLFHSLTPPLMKNLLGPEHILTVFRQFLTLRSDQKRQPLIEEYAKELFIGFVCPEQLAKEEILQSLPNLNEHEIAMCHGNCDGQDLCFLICLQEDPGFRQTVISWIKELLNEKRRALLSKTLRISLARPTLLLDPRIGTDRTSGAIIKMLYEGLMRLDPTGTPSLGIAEEVHVSSDGKKYTFKLRPTFWSNGLPLKALDFEYAWKKVLEPSFHTIFDYLFNPIRNAAQVKAGKLPMEELGVHSPSDDVLIVELEHPATNFLELCCLWIYSPLCQEVDQAHPGWAYYGDRTYVCNGPFKLAKWCRSSGLQVVKNERYWDHNRVSLERIDISIIEDPLHALELFERGELDWIGEPLSETPMCIVKQNNPFLHSQPMSAVQWYILNALTPPFRSSKVRRAFSYAINRHAIIKSCLYGDERPSHSILPASLSLLENKTSLPHDIEFARKLFREGMEEQGLSDSFLRPLRFVIYDQEPHKSIAKLVVKGWEEAFGITIQLEIVPWHDFFAKRMGKKEHDILGCVWYSWFRDPLYTFDILKNQSNSINSSKWTSEAFSHLVDRAELSTDKDQRCSLLREAEKLVMREMPIIPIFDYSSRYLKNDAVQNIYVSHVGNVDFKWTTFRREYLEQKESQSDKESPNTSKKEIRLYLQSEVLSLDPRIGGDRRSQLVTKTIYEGLTRVGEDGKPSLALAESVHVSEDGLFYTFVLRPSKWSNGEECTAYDFEKAWKSVLNPSFPSSYCNVFSPIRNARAARAGECPIDDVGITAVDKRTLKIALEHKTPQFLELIANPVFSPRFSHLDHGKEYVTNGPFLVKECSLRSHIVLEKNQFYHDQEYPKADRISFTIIDEPRQAYHMFQKGLLDWYGGPFGNMLPESAMELDKNGLLMKQQAGGVFWLNCRTSLPQFNSTDIRRGIAHAINRQEICDVILKGGETPAHTILPQAMSLVDTSTTFEYSPELARAYFERGMSKLGLTTATYPPIVINYWSDPSTKVVVQAISIYLQQALGIRVETVLQDWSTYVHKFRTGDFQLAATTWFTWLQDPSYTLTYLKSMNRDSVWTYCQHPDYSKLLDLANTAPSGFKRQQYLRQAEMLVIDELPVIPIFYPIYNYAKAPSLVGESLSSIGIMEMKGLEHTV